MTTRRGRRKFLNVLLLEPYYGGSHQAWADGYQRYSAHDVQLLTLPAQFWKWRMQGGAVTLARLLTEQQLQPDVILASDMMDVSLFRSLARSVQDVPLALYFHENQLTYPQNRRQSHGWQYGFINYASSLAARAIYFNSRFHLNNFFDALPRMLKHFGDYNELQTVEQLRRKSGVLSPGVDLKRFDAYRPADTGTSDNASPLIIWNHRWEADKNPKAFFEALYTLQDDGFDFRVALLGENFRQKPAAFLEARDRLGARVVQFGYADSFADYARLLWQGDYVISTAYQEFFGIAVSEAIYCGCVPLLANRLNYPYLLPESVHSACLFREGTLAGLLRQHLLKRVPVDVSILQSHIAQHDRERLAPLYDAALEQLVASPPDSDR